MKNLMMLMAITLVAVSVTGCKPTYEAPSVDPIMTTAPADAPYEMDFDQLNDDVIDSYSKTHVVFPYVKSMEVTGDNNTKNISVNIDIQSGIPDEAVKILLSDVTKKIADNAYIQDFRLTKSDDNQFGSIYNIYSYSYKVTAGDEVLYDETIQPGDDIPFDPSVDGYTLLEALQHQESAAVTDANSEVSETHD